MIENRRRNLMIIMEKDISLPAVIQAVVHIETICNTVLFSYENIMLQKKVVEREHEIASLVSLIRRRRPGRTTEPNNNFSIPQGPEHLLRG